MLGILEFPKIPSLRNSVIASEAKQSHSKFRHCEILDGILNGILEFGILFARILQTLKAKK